MRSCSKQDSHRFSHNNYNYTKQRACEAASDLTEDLKRLPALKTASACATVSFESNIAVSLRILKKPIESISSLVIVRQAQKRSTKDSREATLRNQGGQWKSDPS
jgi:hypothetical protein